MKYSLHTLSNGLRVVLVPIHEVESVTTLVLVGAGSRYENKKNSGISHFLEHMAFKGTRKRPTAREISSLIDGIGAESNAFTGKEITGYYIKSSSQHLDLSMDILSDMLKNLLLDPKEIEKEKGVILEEINLYEDMPHRKIGDVFEDLLYEDTPMGWDIAGRNKQNIKDATRQDFVNYMGKFYSSSNMALVLAGKFDEKIILEKVKAYFSDLKKFPTEGFEKAPDKQNGPQLNIKQKNTEQAHFALGVRTVGIESKHEDYVLSILASVLGGGMSSRLFHEVRERRGLAYYVRAISENYKDVGYLAAFAGVDKNRIEEAIQVTGEELLKVGKKEEISREELYKAKEYMKGHFILDLEDTRSVAAHYATDLILEGEMKNPDEILAEIDSVGLDEVVGAAEKYLRPERMNMAIIGDFEDTARFKNLLK
jgi:predicted Zn-dependent peptidase